VPRLRARAAGSSRASTDSARKCAARARTSARACPPARDRRRSRVVAVVYFSENCPLLIFSTFFPFFSFRGLRVCARAEAQACARAFERKNPSLLARASALARSSPRALERSSARAFARSSPRVPARAGARAQASVNSADPPSCAPTNGRSCFLFISPGCCLALAKATVWAFFFIAQYYYHERERERERARER